MVSLTDRIARLEAMSAPLSTGRYLAFQVEAAQETPVDDIVTFLRDRGHAIHAEDEVFVMNLGAHSVAAVASVRDLSLALLTEEERAAAPPAGRWPKGRGWFTFKLECPGLNA